MNNWKAFFKAEEMHKKEIVDGDIIRYIYTGKNIQIVEYHFPPNKKFPMHKHDNHEQMGYLVSGKMGFEIGGEKKDLHSGEWYHAAIGIEHRAWTYDSRAILLDIFSPPREDLL